MILDQLQITSDQCNNLWTVKAFIYKTFQRLQRFHSFSSFLKVLHFFHIPLGDGQKTVQPPQAAHIGA